MKEIMISLLLCLLTLSANCEVTETSDLRKIALRQSKAWARQLSIKGIASISKRMDGFWGAKTLNKAYEDSLSGMPVDYNRVMNQSLKKNKQGMMDMNDLLYEFIDKHRILVKSQADNQNHLKFSLYQKKNLGSKFNVNLIQKEGKFGVQFESKEPFVKRSLELNSDNDFKQQIMPFLDSNFKIWKKYTARQLKQIEKESKIENKPEKELNIKQSNKPSLSVLEDIKLDSKLSQDRKLKIDIGVPQKKINNIQPQTIPKKSSQNVNLVNKKNSVHFVEDLDSQERRLTEVSDIEPQLIAATKDKLIVENIDDKTWGVYLKEESGERGDQICFVESDTDDGNEVIKIHNMNISYLENSQKLSVKGVDNQEQPQTLENYFDVELTTFAKIYSRTVSHQYSMAGLAKFIKESFKNMNNIDLEMEIQLMDDSNHEAKFIQLTEVSENPDLALKLRVFRINNLFNQVEVTKAQNQVEMQVPRLMDEVQRENLLKEIQTVLSEEIMNDAIDFDSGLKIILDTLNNDQMCQDVETEKESEGLTAVLSINGNSCPFSDMTVFANAYTYNYFQYFHILVNNQYFQTEHLIPLSNSEEFTETLKDAFSEMANQIQAVKERNNDNSGIEMSYLTEQIKSEVGTLLEIDEVSENEVKFMYTNSKKKKITVVRIVQIDGNDESQTLFRIFLFDPTSHSKHFSKSKTHHEYMMYSDHGEDEFNIFKKDLTKVVHNIETNTKI